jgi:hypothetical protein
MQSYGPVKSWKSQMLEFRDSHLGVLGQNVIWMWASWRGIEYTIRGKVVASPKSRPWRVLWVWVCPWLVLAPKVLQLCTNHLVFGFVQVRVNNWCLPLFLIPFRSSNTPLYPSKVLWDREHASTPCVFVIFSLGSHLNPSRSLGACQWLSSKKLVLDNSFLRIIHFIWEWNFFKGKG